MQTIAQALSLKEGTSEPEILTAIEQLKESHQHLNNRLQKALNQGKLHPPASPSLAEFVTHADYNKALNRASTAEKNLQELKAKQMEEAVDALIARGLPEGKIAPASVEYHKAACYAEQGLEQFEAFLKNVPPVIPEVKIPQNKPNETKSLNQSEKQIFSMLVIQNEQQKETTPEMKKGD